MSQACCLVGSFTRKTGEAARSCAYNGNGLAFNVASVTSTGTLDFTGVVPMAGCFFVIMYYSLVRPKSYFITILLSYKMIHLFRFFPSHCPDTLMPIGLDHPESKTQFN